MTWKRKPALCLTLLGLCLAAAGALAYALHLRTGLSFLALLGVGTLIIIAYHALAIRADRLARSRQSGLSEILDRASSPVFVKDLTGRYLAANRRFQELWGTIPAGAPGKRDEDLFPPETARLFRRHDREALEAGEPRLFEEAAPAGEEELHLVTLRLPLVDGSGEPYALCGISSEAWYRRARMPREEPTRIGAGTLGRVLVIDDERAVREVASAIARELGYDVITADNGAQGLALFEEHRGTVDLVLLDLVMPVLSGNECFRAIRSLEPDTPIIITSGFARGDDVSQLLDEPLTFFLKKPYRRADLAEALARARHLPQPM